MIEQKEVPFVELKVILAVILCLVIIGGAIYLHIKREKK